MLRIDNLSYWEKSTYLENIDFLIIGSGIVGLSTAIFLKKKNKNYKVLVIDEVICPREQVLKMLVLPVLEAQQNFLMTFKT